VDRDALSSHSAQSALDKIAATPDNFRRCRGVTPLALRRAAIPACREIEAAKRRAADLSQGLVVVEKQQGRGKRSFPPDLGSNTYWQQSAARPFFAHLRFEGYPDSTSKKSAEVLMFC
jgi:hypothetical protein